MEKAELKRLIDVAAGRESADFVIKNSRIVDVLGGQILEGDIAVCGSYIAGIGDYHSENEIDAQGRYAAPGFIDSHIHIESSYVTPEEIGRLLVPHGTTTIIADAHEIANVCGLTGLRYMIEAGKGTALDIRWMLPSCVPAAPFEHAGAVIDAEAMREPLAGGEFLGLGEFMDFPGVIGAESGVLDKLTEAKSHSLPVDGHAPGIRGNAVNAYAAARIRTDHECASPEEMQAKIVRGMYVLLREGSACHDLQTLLAGVTAENSRRCLLCTDDCQPRTIREHGHLEHHLRLCVQVGLSPVTAIRMATLNAAECYGLHELGALAPGYRANIVLLDDLRDFHVNQVWTSGRPAAENGRYLPPVIRHDITAVKGSLHIGGFTKEKLRLPLRSDRVYAIGIMPGGVVTRKETVTVRRDTNGCFVRTPGEDIVKIAVIERHHNTGNAAAALLKGYGLQRGAVAISIAHDSHNIITVGVTDEDMAFAVEKLAEQEGGIVLVENGQVLESMPLPVAGLMSDQSGEWVEQRLEQLHRTAHERLGISPDVEPVMTLCFMSLPVIPELKLTDSGLFDVTRFQFIPPEAPPKTEEV